MLEYRAEGLCRNANHLRRDELERCIATGEVLQSTALAFDNERRLRFELAGMPGLMPFEECADGAAEGLVRDVAVLVRVGRPTCFVVEGLRRDGQDRPYLALSRARAQRRSAARNPRPGTPACRATTASPAATPPRAIPKSPSINICYLNMR